jgi:hypothetical protein
MACVLFGVGCGTADREADVVPVSDRFHAALEEGDGARLARVEAGRSAPSRDGVEG